MFRYHVKNWGVSPRSSIEKNANGFRAPGSNISHQAPSFSKLFNIPPTVDGSEIRRSPVEVGSLSHYVHGFLHTRWLIGISEPSTVSRMPPYPKT